MKLIILIFESFLLFRLGLVLRDTRKIEKNHIEEVKQQFPDLTKIGLLKRRIKINRYYHRFFLKNSLIARVCTLIGTLAYLSVCISILNINISLLNISAGILAYAVSIAYLFGPSVSEWYKYMKKYLESHPENELKVCLASRKELLRLEKNRRKSGHILGLMATGNILVTLYLIFIG